MIETLSWTGQSLRLLDQTRLPTQTVYVDITDEKQAWDAIKRLVVRGAPAIGVAAAFGAYLGIQNFSGSPPCPHAPPERSLRLSRHQPADRRQSLLGHEANQGVALGHIERRNFRDR